MQDYDIHITVQVQAEDEDEARAEGQAIVVQMREEFGDDAELLCVQEIREAG